MKPYKIASGNFSNSDATAADLERGFIASSGEIPDDGENVFNPKSAERYRMMAYMKDEEPGFEGGFLGRDDCGHERY